jgi:hypothetical protein
MEEFTCIECEKLYDSSDGDTDARMCAVCISEMENEYEKNYNEKSSPNFVKQVDGLVG